MAQSPDGSRGALVFDPQEERWSEPALGNAVLATIAPDGSGLRVLVRIGSNGKLVPERDLV